MSILHAHSLHAWTALQAGELAGGQQFTHSLLHTWDDAVARAVAIALAPVDPCAAA